MEKSDSEVSKMLILGLGIGLIIGGVIGYLYSAASNKGTVAAALNEDEVKKNAEEFINKNLLQPGINAKVENVTRNGGLFELQVMLSSGAGSQRVKSYVSGDGSLLFPNAINMTETLTELSETTPPQAQTQVDMKALIDDDPFAGSIDAKVVIVEFSDFQCPFCAKAAPTVTLLKETYGDKILFVYRDFPISSIHPEAGKAAESAQCAFEQDRFWEYHDLLFEKQQEWAGLGTPKFKEYAAGIGLNASKFNDCLDSGRYGSEVEADLQEGTHFGVTGTPTFFINDKIVVGAQPFSVFQGIIDEGLSK